MTDTTVTRNQYAITIEIAESPDGGDHSQNEPLVLRAAKRLTEYLCGRNGSVTVEHDGTTVYEGTVDDD